MMNEDINSVETVLLHSGWGTLRNDWEGPAREKDEDSGKHDVMKAKEREFSNKEPLSHISNALRS